MRRHLLEMVALAVGLFVAGPVLAEDGQFFIGLGGVQNSIVGDLNGMHAFVNTTSSTNQTIFDGKFDSGRTGLALLVGFAINPYVGVEVELQSTSHQATSYLRSRTTDATFTDAFIGGRLNLPLSKSWRFFVRGGFGGYVAAYNDFAVDNVTGQTGKVVFSGGGSAAGAGLEVRGTHWGLASDYTEHNFTLDSASTDAGGSSKISPRLRGIADATTLMVLYYF